MTGFQRSPVVASRLRNSFLHLFAWRRRKGYCSSLLWVSAVVLAVAGCQSDEFTSDPNCRPAGRITTDVGSTNVQLLMPKAGRLTRAEEDSLLSNFNYEARNVAPHYCLNHTPPCAWYYRPANRNDIERKRNFQFMVGGAVRWRTLPPFANGAYRMDVWIVSPSQDNVACRQVVTITLPPPRRTASSTTPPTAEPAERQCNSPKPAWNRTPGLYGGRVGSDVDPLDSIEVAEERFFIQQREAQITQWETEITAACRQANPGHECAGGFDVEPDITYDRHPLQRNRQTGRERVVIELRLLNTVNGVCQ